MYWQKWGACGSYLNMSSIDWPQLIVRNSQLRQIFLEWLRIYENIFSEAWTIPCKWSPVGLVRKISKPISVGQIIDCVRPAPSPREIIRDHLHIWHSPHESRLYYASENINHYQNICLNYMFCTMWSEYFLCVNCSWK